MFLYILCIASLCMKSILACSVHVRLTWEAKTENITFKCKISPLKYSVNFRNPKNEEEGYCAIPVPRTLCQSSHNVIYQDLQTNTTVLVIQRHVDNRLNGAWKCYHGINRDAAIVNVTVLQETFKIIFKNDNCGEQHMAWTSIGVLIGLFIIFIVWMIPKTHKAYRDFYSQNCCGSWRNCSPKVYYATTFFTCILLMCLTISLAYVSGLLENNCKDKKLFIIFGLCMVFMSVICLTIPKKATPKAHKDNGKDIEPANNHLLDKKESVAEKRNDQAEHEEKM